jgi:hypothetical protein
MSKISSKILDSIAANQFPVDLDLTPKIIAQIEKNKGVQMHSRIKFAGLVLAAAIAITVTFFAVPAVAQAVGRWFGFVPGVGLVQSGQVRVLEKPVSLTRDGVTVTVDQVVLNEEASVLVYSVTGIPSDATKLNPEAGNCSNEASLHLADGSVLLASPMGLLSQDVDYQIRYEFPALPMDFNDATLEIKCLYFTQPGTTPENWEIPLHFVPAPADMTAYPVIELPSFVSSAEKEGATSTNQENDSLINLTVDRSVLMDDSILVYATLHWEDSPNGSVGILQPEDSLHLLDGNGNELAYEMYYDDNTLEFVDEKRTAFAIKATLPQDMTDLKLVLDSEAVILPTDITFSFDPGTNQETGAIIPIDKDFEIEGKVLKIHSAVLEQGGYTFEMSSDTGIRLASLSDPEGTITMGVDGEGSNDGSEYIFFSSFYYDGERPEHSINVAVRSIKIQMDQLLEATFTIPAQ